MEERISSLLSLKETGNRQFIQGTKNKSNPGTYFRQACLTYGKVLEGMIHLEGEYLSETLLNLEFVLLKPTIFLNLATSNLKLGNPEGCRRCCNCSLLFCQKPELLLDDMGVEDDVTIDIQIDLPIMMTYLTSILSKALFRRGQCLMENYKLYSQARDDFEKAKELQPGDKFIIKALDEANRLFTSTLSTKNKISTSESIQFPSSLIAWGKKLSSSDLSSLTINGGYCLCRQGLWTQNITETRIYFPLVLLFQSWQNSVFPSSSSSSSLSSASSSISSLSDLSSLFLKKDCWKIHFERDSIEINVTIPPSTPSTLSTPSSLSSSSSSTSNLHNESIHLLVSGRLEYPIQPSECTWMIETIHPSSHSESSNPSSSSSSSLYVLSSSMLVLYLSKSHHKERRREIEKERESGKERESDKDMEWYPGCEWWDRVFQEDEPIDTTLCCSVGSRVDELPVEAKIRAEKEHARFLSLSSSSSSSSSSSTENLQNNELQHLQHVKKSFEKSLQNTFSFIQEEEQSIQEVPQRGEMLTALRDEFPHIDFRAK